jgi:RHS repeat-associated protein
MTGKVFRRYAAAVLFFIGTLFQGAVRAQAVDIADIPAAPVYSQLDERNVDLSSGNLYIADHELSIGTKENGLEFARFWVGGYQGWRHSYEMSVSFDSEYGLAQAFVKLGGETKTFSYPVNGNSTAYTSDQGDGSTLTENSSSFTYTAHDGTVIYFDKSLSTGNRGIATTITKPNGLKIYITYTSTGLKSVNSSSGFQLKFSSTANGYSVQAINNAVEYCNPTADSCSLSQNWPSVSFSSPDRTTEYVTDSMNRQTRYTYSDSFDGSGMLLMGIKRPSSSGDDITYSYNTSWDYPASYVTSASVTGVGTWTYAFTYYSGLVATVTTPTIATPKVVVSNGRPTSITDENGNVTTFQYDSSNMRLIKETLPEGNYNSYSYDSRGNVLSIVKTPKSGSGLATVTISASYPSTCTNPLTCNKAMSVTDALGKTTDYTYDGTQGGVLTVTSPPATSGGIRPQTRYSYTALSAWYKNSAGALVQAVSPVYLITGTSTCQTTASCSGASDEAKTAISYQAGSSSVGSNLLPLSTSAGSGTTPVMTSSSMTYDIVGNVVTQTDPLSSVSYTFYDAVRAVTGTISPDPDGAGAMKRRAARLTYNADGQVITAEQGTLNGTAASDLAGMTVLRKVDTNYDSVGRKAQNAVTAGGTLYAVTQYSYNGAGRPECSARRMNPAMFGSLPSSACSLGTAGSFGADRINRNVYDAVGQVLKVQTGYGTAQQRDEVTNSYTNNGKTLSVTDAKGNKTSYVYDGFDRLVKTYYPNPSSAGSSSTTDYEQLTYDTGSRVTQRRLRDGNTITIGYDDLSHPTSKTYSSGDGTLSYTYDLLNRPGTVTKPSGNVITYSYDALGRRTSEGQPFGSASSQYDAAGRRTRLTWNDGYCVSYGYLATNEMTAIKEGGANCDNSLLATFTYDDLGHRVGLSRSNGTSTSYSYDYPTTDAVHGTADRLGCMWQDLNGGTTQAACSTTPTASGQDQLVNFAYNPASQMTRRTSANDTYAWTQSYNVSRGYTANGLNQYTASGSITPTYDARGNLTSAGGTTYSYTSENLLSAAAGATNATMGYDGLGRVIEYDTTVSTRFVYDGSNLIAEVDNPSGTVLRRYVHGPGADEPLIWYEGSGTTDRRWLHADERGSIIAVTDGSGNAIAINSYDAWGIPQTTNLGRFQYTGQTWLAELGLYNYKARIYSATLGRFLQTDPTGYEDGPNWYAYVGNDPVNRSDSTGLYECKQTDCKEIAPLVERLKYFTESFRPHNAAEQTALATAKSALKTLGTENDGNGLKVSGVSLNADYNGSNLTLGKGNRSEVRLDFKAINVAAKSMGDNSKNFLGAAVLGHEATHSLQDKTSGPINNDLSVEFQREKQAYTVQSYVDSFYGTQEFPYGGRSSYINNGAKQSCQQMFIEGINFSAVPFTGDCR